MIIWNLYSGSESSMHCSRRKKHCKWRAAPISQHMQNIYCRYMQHEYKQVQIQTQQADTAQLEDLIEKTFIWHIRKVEETWEESLASRRHLDVTFKGAVKEWRAMAKDLMDEGWSSVELLTGAGCDESWRRMRRRRRVTLIRHWNDSWHQQRKEQGNVFWQQWWDWLTEAASESDWWNRERSQSAD